MKFCPQCHQFYYDGQKFCEADGTSLIDISSVNAAAQSAAAMRRTFDPPTPRGWLIGAVGIFIGVVLCVLLFTARLNLPGPEGTAVQDASAYATQPGNPTTVTQPAPARTPAREQPSILSLPAEAQPQLTTEASPAPAASPQPTAEVSSRLSATQAENNQAENNIEHLSDGPPTTGLAGKRPASGKTILHLKDGTRMEVDEAWEERGGIWYRQGALVSFTQRNRVESITEAPVLKESPKESPKAAPSPSPVASSSPLPKASPTASSSP
jgi:hypothetical protein